MQLYSDRRKGSQLRWWSQGAHSNRLRQVSRQMKTVRRRPCTAQTILILCGEQCNKRVALPLARTIRGRQGTTPVRYPLTAVAVVVVEATNGIIVQFDSVDGGGGRGPTWSIVCTLNTGVNMSTQHQDRSRGERARTKHALHLSTSIECALEYNLVSLSRTHTHFLNARAQKENNLTKYQHVEGLNRVHIVSIVVENAQNCDNESVSGWVDELGGCTPNHHGIESMAPRLNKLVEWNICLLWWWWWCERPCKNALHSHLWLHSP